MQSTVFDSPIESATNYLDLKCVSLNWFNSVLAICFAVIYSDERKTKHAIFSNDFYSHSLCCIHQSPLLPKMSSKHRTQSLNEDVAKKRQQSDIAPENELRQSSIAKDTFKTNTSSKMERQKFATLA